MTFPRHATKHTQCVFQTTTYQANAVAHMVHAYDRTVQPAAQTRCNDPQPQRLCGQSGTTCNVLVTYEHRRQGATCLAALVQVQQQPQPPTNQTPTIRYSNGPGSRVANVDTAGAQLQHWTLLEAGVGMHVRGASRCTACYSCVHSATTVQHTHRQVGVGDSHELHLPVVLMPRSNTTTHAPIQ